MHAPWTCCLASLLLATVGARADERSAWPWEWSARPAFHSRLAAGETLLDVSPDGRQAAFAGAEGTVRVAALTAGGADELADGGTLAGMAAPPTIARWGGDGSLWIGDHAGNLTAWDRATDDRRLAIQAHQGPILDLALAPDGKRVATAGFDKAAKVWDTASGKLVRALDGHAASVRAVAFSPDGSILASAGGDRTVRLWNLARGDDPQVLLGHNGTIRALLFAPDGSWLASAGEDKLAILWDPKSGTELHRLQHGDTVAALALARGGELLATGSWDGVISAWDPRSGNKRHASEPQVLGVRYMRELPGGDLLASHGELGISLLQAILERQANALVLDGTTEGVDWIFVGAPGEADRDPARPERNLPPAPERIWTIDKTGMVRIWDERGGTIGQFRAHKGSVAAAALSPNGAVLATAGRDRSLALWDAHSGTLLGRHGDQAGMIRALAFSPDSKLLVSAGADRRLVPRRGSDGEPEGPAIEVPAPVAALDFEPDGKTLLAAVNLDDSGRVLRIDIPKRAATGSEISVPRPIAALARVDAGILILDDGGSLLVGEVDLVGAPRALTRPGEVTALARGADRTRFVTGQTGGVVRLWEAKGWRASREMVGMLGVIGSVAIGPGGMVAAAPRGGFGYVWSHPRAGTREGLAAHEAPVTGVAVTADGTRILSCARNGSIRIWDAIKRTVRGSLDFESDQFLAAAAGSEQGVVGAADGSLLVLDLEEAKVLARLTGHGDEVKCVAMAADGRTAVSGGRDGTIHLWNLDSRRQTRSFEEAGDRDPVTAVALSADGQRVLAAGGTGGRQFLTKRDEGVLRVWDTQTGELVARLIGTPALCAALAPDGRRALVGGKDGSLSLWDTAKGERIKSWRAHGGFVTACSFSSAGNRVLSGGFDKTVRLWDSATGAPIDHDGGNTGAILAAALAPDGTWAVSGGSDSLVTIWSLERKPSE